MLERVTTTPLGKVLRAPIVLLLVTAMAASGRADPAPAKTSAPGYTLQLPSRVELEAGQLAPLQLRLQPAPGYRLSKKAPLRIDLEPSADSGVTVKKARMDRGDATDPASSAPTFRAQLRAGEPGTFELGVSLQFWLCRGKLCTPVRSEATVQVEVRAAADPPGPDAGVASESAARTAPN